jgi:hypothetical protein
VDQLVEWLVGSGSIGMANKWDGCIIFGTLACVSHA